MTLQDLQNLLDKAYESNDLSDPGIFIRIGNLQAPLSSIRAIPEDDNFYECIILQDKDYEDVIV